MKKTLLFTITALCLATLAVYARPLALGYGKVLTAATNATELIVMDNTGTNRADASECSVVVSGSETVYIQKNCSTNGFNGFVLTNAIPVTSAVPYSF